MTVSHGFELVRDEEVSEVNARARIWRHLKTGAELLSMENEDENKAFGVSFRTPPTDSTGVAHIMEHSVLGGSRKYQVKEPFLEMVKGSLQTFLNAFTAADKTIYPVASTNLQDFYNLVDVYLDAVFFPLITPHHLQQEGWHYELENTDAPLTYKGVVFNEMKGVYSSPDSLLQRFSQRSLFPDNAYVHDSGGDPEAIPDLTYEQFKGFHQRYYHPSNALIYFYGDDDPEERLRLLNTYLEEFDRLEVDGHVTLQASFTEPRQMTLPYTVEAGETNGHRPKAFVQLNWLLPEFRDPAEVMSLTILSHALLSTPASPLRKALLDSGLGEDLTGGGLSTWTRQMTFSAGMKGVEEENVSAVEELILQTLRDIAGDGFDPDMIEASLNTIEFRLRENNTGQFPRGLSLMLTALTTWQYGRDPLMAMRYEEPLGAVKERLAADPAYLQQLIQTHLLDNPHRTTVILEPDPELAARREAQEKSRLEAARAAFTARELEEIVENAAELRRLQEMPDSPEALATLPMLTLEDLEPEIKTIPLAEETLAGTKLLYHDLFTNGIVYFDLGFNLHTLPEALLPYVPLFGRALLEMGTEEEDFVKLSQRIGRRTGGIYATTVASSTYRDESSAAWLLLRGKATGDQAHELLDILRDVLLTAKFDDRERFRQIVLKAKAGKESSLVPAGHSVVNTRLRARFSEAGWLNEQMGGISQLFFLRELAEQIEQNWPAVLEKLEQVRIHLLNRQTMIANATVDADGWAAFRQPLADFLAELPQAEAHPVAWERLSLPDNEGLTIPAQVNYVGKAANLYELGYELDGSVSVISNYLRTTWLWEKIRVQGGAYGAFCSFSRLSGVLSFLSYRDPNLEATLDVYDRTAAFLRDVSLSQDELTKNIIGTIGSIDAYQLPDAKGYTSLQRYLIGQTDERRQQYRDQVLSTTAADFRAFGDALARLNDAAHVVVLGSSEAIANANAGKDWLTVKKVL